MEIDLAKHKEGMNGKGEIRMNSRHLVRRQITAFTAVGGELGEWGRDQCHLPRSSEGLTDS